MALKSFFHWRNADSTADLNARLSSLVQKGVVWAAADPPVQPGVGLSVAISPFVAYNREGMTVTEGTPTSQPVVAGQTSVVFIRSRYNPFGTPATPILRYEVLEESVFNLDPEKDYLVELVRVTLAPAAVGVTLNDMDFTFRDEVDVIGRSWFRGVVAIPGDLPLPPPTVNRVGDFYYVASVNTFYHWDGSGNWIPLSTGSFNVETGAMNRQTITQELQRIVDGTGVIAGERPHPAPGIDTSPAYSSKPDVSIIDTPSVANEFAIDSFTSAINGHAMPVRSQSITLTAPVDRFDLIFLEMWREAIAVPDIYQYEKSPDGATTYTLDQLDAFLQLLQWVSGLGNLNFDVNAIEVKGHAWVILKYRFGVVEAVSENNLVNPSIAAPAALNVDGIAFSAGATPMDSRAWSAASTTSDDGMSWAMPFLLVRRTVAENPGAADGIKEFRLGDRYIFHIYPVCDTVNAARKTVDTTHKSEPYPWNIRDWALDKPSGFMLGHGFPLGPGGGPNELALAPSGLPFKVRVRGLEEYIDFDHIALSAPPVASYSRYVVYLQLNVVLYPHESTRPDTMLSKVHRPWVPSDPTSLPQTQGWKRGYAQWELKWYKLTTPAIDEDIAMADAGWTKGDLSLKPIGLDYEDGGIYSRPIALIADWRANPWGHEWAIPITIVHQRNTVPWTYVNQNGVTVTRPDERQDATVISPKDLVDLRHRVDLTTAELKNLLEEDMSKNMRGQLRTRMAQKYQGSGGPNEVAGTQILQSDFIGNVPGEYNMTPGDDLRRIWSDAREYQIMAANFDLFTGVPIVNTHYEYSYDGPNNRGTLVIKAPAYCHLVRHIPAMVVADAGVDDTDPDFMEFAGPPLWASQQAVTNAIPSPADAKYIDTNTPTNEYKSLPFYLAADQVTPTPEVQGFLVTNRDSLGNATEMTGYIDTSGIVSGDAVLSWWVHYDRSFVSPYDVNFGLSEIPDEVHRVTRDPLGVPSQLNIGPMHVFISKTLVAAGSFTISAAEVSAATPLTGAITLIGADVNESAKGAGFGTTSLVMSGARDLFTFNLIAPYTGIVHILVFFTTSDVDHWVHIGRGGKSVQALYKWDETAIPDLGAQPAPAGVRTVSLGEDVNAGLNMPWGKIGRNMFVWAKTLAATDWTLANFTAPYEHVNFASFEQGGLDQEANVIIPLHFPLSGAASDTIEIDYTYTPYQGLSADGGRAPTVNPALLTQMKDQLHGVVLEQTDFHVLQSGAASFFSGIECWTGIPANHANPNFNAAVRSGDRFSVYNNHSLVLPRNVQGLPAISSRAVSAEQVNAAAILRFPFPFNFNMADVNYHVGVMDFDLDPARAGVAAGFASYAPGYWGGPVASVTKARNDQFVNGLARLLAHGSDREVAESLLFKCSDFQPSNAQTSPLVPSAWAVNMWTTAGVGQLLNLLLDIPSGGQSNVKRLSTLCRGTPDEILHTSGGSGIYSGLRLYNPRTRAYYDATSVAEAARWLINISGGPTTFNAVHTAHVSPAPTQEWYISLQPGAIIAYYLARGEVLPTLELSFEQTGAPFMYMHSCGALVETDFAANRSLGNPGILNFLAGDRVMTDHVILPFGSLSDVGSSPAEYRAAGRTSLKGLRIAYPAGWSGPTITNLEALLTGTVDLKGSGRGLYFGTADQRFNMSVFVPGSGDSLREVLVRGLKQIFDVEEIPEMLPYASSETPFVETNKQYYPYDHGGQIAYSCFALAISPDADEFRSRVVMQIMGGPVGKLPITLSNDLIRPEDLDGTAIDAFWPTGRPIMARTS